MPEERYVAAIEISSSKIIGAVGIPNNEGRLNVVAIEQEKCQNCVRRGLIQNVDETAGRINRIITKLQRKTSLQNRIIKGVFIGISGRSMRNIVANASMQLPDESIVTEKVVEALRKQAQETPVDSYLDIVDVVPRSYVVGDLQTQTPVGAIGNSINAVFDLIAVRPELKKNIKRTLEKIPGLKNEGFIVTPMATAHLILSEDEKRLGCMLVDMGAETTTVTIFKHGALHYFATIPIGSRNITQDITSLSVLEDRAEELKVMSGSAIAPEIPSTLYAGGVKASDVTDIVVARSNEIVANIIAQIQYADMTRSDLPGGIILVGGGAKLKNMPELLAQQSLLNVRQGSLPSFVRIDDPKMPHAEFIEVVSVLYAAATHTDVNCLEFQQRSEVPVNGQAPAEEEPREKKPERPQREREQRPGRLGGFIKKLQDKLANLNNVDDDEDGNDGFDQ